MRDRLGDTVLAPTQYQQRQSQCADQQSRALAGNHPLLIFDDCLSAVDTETETSILRELRGEIRGRTAILISHRISTVRDADLILVLEDGRVAEAGTHEELLLNNGYYTKLYRMQKLEGREEGKMVDDRR